ncbi:hypothetical protein KY285_007956 [Solanum tuberosum]|nr:hypothetical protein KY285_007956 [Solanum tuberosum]
MERDGSCMVPLVKVSKKEGHAYLSAMHIMKGLMKGEPTFIATIASSREDIGAKEPLPPIVEKDLEENKDVMPDELPRTLPPRGEVHHKIELEVGAKPPTHAPYRMAPPELEGPFKIVAKVGKISYKVDLPPHFKIHPVFHTCVLKPYHEDKKDSSRNQSQQALITVIASHEREIKAIIDYQANRK